MKKELMAEGNRLKSDEDIVRFLYVNVHKQRQKEFYSK